MNAAATRILQTRLQSSGLYSGAIDGIRGPVTNAAVLAALEARENMTPGWRAWTARRRATALLQLVARDAGLAIRMIDGWWGPETAAATRELAVRIEAAEDDTPPGAPAGALRPPGEREGSPERADERQPPRMAPIPPRRPAWPRETPQDLVAVYGPHGLPAGRTPPLVAVPCPWPLRLAWNTGHRVGSISIHERCAESLARILARAFERYGGNELVRLGLDRYGGSYNPRRMRGGRRWSTHAWGCAIDWDPARNRFRWGSDRASLARPELEDWWRTWEEEGWVSLGRTRDYDWMHVQAAVP